MDGIVRMIGVRMIGCAALVTAAVVAMTAAAEANGNAAAGKDIFARCAICHSSAKDAPNKIGPNLWGIVGRKAGTYPGFNYSPAMKNSNITWTEEKLEAYVQHPQAVVPGNRMPFAGLSSPKQAEDLTAYLDTLK